MDSGCLEKGSPWLKGPSAASFERYSRVQLITAVPPR